MTYLIGTDEAGYGPNLGPLVISATVWEVPDQSSQHDLYEHLAEIVSVDGSAGCCGPRIPIADSKQLYSSKGSIARLEEGLFTALGSLGIVPNSWQEVWKILAADSLTERDELPWYHGFDAPVPFDANSESIDELLTRFVDVLEKKNIKTHSIRSRVVFPGSFNSLVKKWGTKGAALSRLTLELIKQQLDRLPILPCRIVCDKHGGRNKYGPLLQEIFPDHLVEIFQEGRSESLYRWGPQDCRVEICFRTGGEEFLPSALASMASKYLRELAMKAFNHYWCGQVTGLRPTAGYPVDAKRFKAEIAGAQDLLKIEDRVLWRSR